MYEHVASIRFKGAGFRDLTTLMLFPCTNKATSRVCLLYGKNGSGKTTISRAIRKLCGSEMPEIEEASLLDMDGKPITLTGSESNSIFIFDEDYTHDHVRIKDDGLKTIVMLGDQGDLEDKIKEASVFLAKALEKKEDQEQVCKKYDDVSSKFSPKYYLLKMKTALQGDENWAGRERIIDIITDPSRRQNAAVRDDTYKQIILKRPSSSVEELRTIFKIKLSMLQNAADEARRIQNNVSTSIALSSSEAKITSLLEAKLEHPRLSEREKYLLVLVESGKIEQLENMKTEFVNPSTLVCPFCIQPISAQYKADLITSIQKVLSKEAEVHQRELRSAKIDLVEYDFTPFSELDSNLLQNCMDCLSALNDAITYCNNMITQKLLNVYFPIIGVTLAIDEKKVAFIEALCDLEENRKEFNKQFVGIKKIRDDLHELNIHLAYYEIIDLNIDFEKQTQEIGIEKEKLFELSQDELTKRQAYNELLVRKNSIRIAVDIINQSLQYVFFSTERLHIDVKDNVYSLTSNGNPVKPKNVSAGERNIISLCYFFVDMMNNLDCREAYQQERLL
ncbi:MAG: AAA family ATPase, partial [Eubacteriales bacterium]|nr:AAA family ATPase [Eubacteriales bacterium]